MSTTTITVTGMSCDACASAVRTGLTSIPGVVDVDIIKDDRGALATELELDRDEVLAAMFGDVLANLR